MCKIIEISCPADDNITKKVEEKLNNYGPLVRNLQIMYPHYKIRMIPIVRWVMFSNVYDRIFINLVLIEGVYVTIGNPAFCVFLYLTGVHFRGELQHGGDVSEWKIKCWPSRTRAIGGVSLSDKPIQNIHHLQGDMFFMFSCVGFSSDIKVPPHSMFSV